MGSSAKFDHSGMARLIPRLVRSAEKQASRGAIGSGNGDHMVCCNNLSGPTAYRTSKALTHQS